jgi:hypothetical protein
MNAAEHANVAHLTLFKATEMPAPFLCPIGITLTHLGWMDGQTDG